MKQELPEIVGISNLELQKDINSAIEAYNNENDHFKQKVLLTRILTLQKNIVGDDLKALNEYIEKCRILDRASYHSLKNSVRQLEDSEIKKAIKDSLKNLTKQLNDWNEAKASNFEAKKEVKETGLELWQAAKAAVATWPAAKKEKAEEIINSLAFSLNREFDFGIISAAPTGGEEEMVKKIKQLTSDELQTLVDGAAEGAFKTMGFPSMEGVNTVNRKANNGIVFESTSEADDKKIITRFYPNSTEDDKKRINKLNKIRAEFGVDAPYIIGRIYYQKEVKGADGKTLGVLQVTQHLGGGDVDKRVGNLNAEASNLTAEQLTEKRQAMAIDFAGKIAEALDKAQSHGYYLADLKPGNVLTDPEGNIYFSDYKAFVTQEDLDNGEIPERTPAFEDPAILRIKSVNQVENTAKYSLGVMIYMTVKGLDPATLDKLSKAEIDKMYSGGRTIPATFFDFSGPEFSGKKGEALKDMIQSLTKMKYNPEDKEKKNPIVDERKSFGEIAKQAKAVQPPIVYEAKKQSLSEFIEKQPGPSKEEKAMQYINQIAEKAATMPVDLQADRKIDLARGVYEYLIGQKLTRVQEEGKKAEYKFDLKNPVFTATKTGQALALLLPLMTESKKMTFEIVKTQTAKFLTEPPADTGVITTLREIKDQRAEKQAKKEYDKRVQQSANEQSTDASATSTGVRPRR